MAARDQFIIGYGSLIESQARAAVAPFLAQAFPVNIAGLERGWFGQLSVAGAAHATYLAAVRDSNYQCNGVIFKVTEAQLEAFDKHEAGYDREKIDSKNVTMLDGGFDLTAGDIWFYTCKERHSASRDYPILQSYVDTCLLGCLEVEAIYPAAKAAGFATEFLKTSTNWSEHWLNDRELASGSVMPAAHSKIDELIRSVLGERLQTPMDTHKVRYTKSEPGA